MFNPNRILHHAGNKVTELISKLRVNFHRIVYLSTFKCRLGLGPEQFLPGCEVWQLGMPKLPKSAHVIWLSCVCNSVYMFLSGLQAVDWRQCQAFLQLCITMRAQVHPQLWKTASDPQAGVNDQSLHGNFKLCGLANEKTPRPLFRSSSEVTKCWNHHIAG